MVLNSYTKHYFNTFDKKVKEFNNHAGLLPYFAPMIGKKKKVRIAELGCALVNTIGDMWPGVEVEVVCSDKHAKDFNAIWKEKGVTPLHPIHEEDMENLSYPDNSFDIVHCVNALDHTKNPLRAIEEMKRVTKEWIYLRHAEGQKRIYGGHHYYNMEDLPLEGFETTRDGKWIVSVWKK